VRLYDTLFLDEFPTPDSEVNARSLTVITGARVDPSLDALPAGSTLQFERLGYFCKDPDSKPGAPVLNRTITLKDTWAKIEKKSSSS
jgi:glutaminyl-tRNA synthetase